MDNIEDNSIVSKLGALLKLNIEYSPLLGKKEKQSGIIYSLIAK